MKKFYAFSAAALAALSMNAQLYVCGNGVGLDWIPSTPLEVEEVDGKYTFEVQDLVQMKLSTTKGETSDDWTGFNAGGFNCTYTEADLGQAVDMEASDDPGNISTPWKGDYTVVVVLGETPTLTMTTNTPKPEGNTPVYVRGSMDEGWAALPEWQFTNTNDEPGKYEFVCQGATTILSTYEFKIADADWGDINYGFGLVTVNTYEEYIDGDEVGAHWNYNADNCSVAEDFEGVIYVSFDAENPKNGADVMFLTDVPEGIASVAVDANAPAVYYNLQGVQVDAPSAGLYIVRKGNTTFKTVIR